MQLLDVNSCGGECGCGGEYTRGEFTSTCTKRPIVEYKMTEKIASTNGLGYKLTRFHCPTGLNNLQFDK